jgi:RNA polymerase sigma factor (sigma-70 family)
MSTNNSEKNFNLDSSLIEAIAGTEAEMNEAIRFLYKKNFRLLTNYIVTNNGTREEAEDIFQDVIVSFINIVKQQKFRGESSIQTFLFTMNKHFWFNELKRKKNTYKRETKYVNEQVAQQNSITMEADPVHAKDLINLLDQLGPKCKQILVSYYYENQTIKEILSGLNYENEQVVRNKKYKCLKMLQEIVLGNPTLVNYLKIIKNG